MTIFVLMKQMNVIPHLRNAVKMLTGLSNLCLVDGMPLHATKDSYEFT